MMCEQHKHKWNKRYSKLDRQKLIAADVLMQNLHLLPKSGTALDYACGLGVNAFQLACLGFDVSAWDISSVAIEKLNTEAKSRSLNIQVEVRDLAVCPPEKESFDIILVSRYLDRGAVPSLIRALKLRGVIFYQTYTRENSEATVINNHEFLLKSNELLDFFSELRILSFKDEGVQGDLQRGLRNESWIVAKKEERV